MNQERMQILKMLEEGTVTAAEAAELLSAVDKTGRPSPESFHGRWMRVVVSDQGTGKEKVRVTVPLGLVEVALRLGARFVPSSVPLDPQEVLEAIRSGEPGKIIEVEDLEHGERVEIYVD